MPAYDEFKTLMLSEARRLVGEMTKRDRAVVRESIADMLGHDVASRTAPRELNAHGELSRVLFLRFSEIQASVESLENIERYLRRAPDRRLEVSKAAYLRYHVENYLAELYLLKERLIAYGTLISRRYKSDHRAIEMVGTVSTLNDSVQAAFGGIGKARGRHVHESRFDDSELSKVRFFDMLREGDDTLAQVFEVAYREVRSSKLRWVRETNEQIKQLLDFYFGALKPLLFTESGSLRTPCSAPSA